MQQTLIDFEPPAAAPIHVGPRPSVEVRFLQFVTANPSVPQAIIRMARARKASGHQWWSMRAAFEVLRDNAASIIGREAVPGGHRVRINNDYTGHMARLVMRMAPDLDGFFKTR